MSTTPLVPPPGQIDSRGPQFTAGLTSALLVAVLLTVLLGQPTVAVALLAVQAALFATGVALGVQRTPTAFLFRRYVRPRLSPATSYEDPRPPRFAQGIGLGFAAAGLVGLTVGPLWLGLAAVGLALAAALLNATIQFCLGCQIYGVCRLPQATDHQTVTTNDTKEVFA